MPPPQGCWEIPRLCTRRHFAVTTVWSLPEASHCGRGPARAVTPLRTRMGLSLERHQPNDQRTLHSPGLSPRSPHWRGGVDRGGRTVAWAHRGRVWDRRWAGLKGTLAPVHQFTPHLQHCACPPPHLRLCHGSLRGPGLHACTCPSWAGVGLPARASPSLVLCCICGFYATSNPFRHSTVQNKIWKRSVVDGLAPPHPLPGLQGEERFA